MKTKTTPKKLTYKIL